MDYLSTRGQCPPLPFRDTVLTGLAPDGGLFLPRQVPDVTAQLQVWRHLSFQEVFRGVVSPFVTPDLAPDVLQGLVERSYAAFRHPQVTPVQQVGGVFVCELFHGPTLAFKDVALQFLGHLFEHFLLRGEQRLTVLGATSGDTGSAAIHALKGRRGIEVFILYPHGRVSPTQELQMTTVAEPNVHALAVEGSFDDAQAIVKALFGDTGFNAEVHLGAVNSINWARVMAQITYFFYAYFRVLEARTDAGMRLGDPVRVAVPTGNFGHIFAGVMARRMGLPIERLLLGTNENAILHRFVQSGRYEKGSVHHTLSPSMDIQVASNFERYLFLLAGEDAARVRGWMDELRDQGGFIVPEPLQAQVHADFDSLAVSDEETVGIIRRVHADHDYLLDPHSAVGFRAAEVHGGDDMPTIAMATAHPGKFSEAIGRAIGTAPPLPEALAELERLPQRREVLPATAEAVREHIRRSLSRAG